MKPNVIQLATVFSFHENFNKDNISILQKMGFSVHLISNNLGTHFSEDRKKTFLDYCLANSITVHFIKIPRNPFNFISLIRSYCQLLKLVKYLEPEFLHSHTPVGGVLGRLVAKRLKIKNIYTVHGFHFYKGSSILSWIVFYNLERYLSKYTDLIITINKEDFELSQSRMFSRTFYVPGVGINCDSFSSIERNRSLEDINLLSVGELNINKNHSFVINALKFFEDGFRYYIAGVGDLEKNIMNLVSKHHLDDSVELLGYVFDVRDILAEADLFIFPSRREGLSIALIEAMASGLPVIASDIRGNRDLINHGLGGYLYVPDNQTSFLDALHKLAKNPALTKQMGEYNREKAKQYDISKIRYTMEKIYSDFLN